jgi:ankyrin repeat protein
MKCVERGHFEDLQQIKLELNNDPYKFLRNATHPYALINKRNKDGLTPLYVACRNGNFDVVQFLMQENADYLIPSVIGNEEETNLEVAVRWSHTKIVKELLIKKWPKPTLLKAKKICNSQKILDLFKKKKKSKCLCFCRKIKN